MQCPLYSGCQGCPQGGVALYSQKVFEDQRKVQKIENNYNLLVVYTHFYDIFVPFGQFPVFNNGIAHSGSEPFILSSVDREYSN